MYSLFSHSDLMISVLLCCSVKPFAQGGYPGKPSTAVSGAVVGGGDLQAPPPPPWEGRAIATHKLRLVEFSAFMEQHREPDTVSTHSFFILITPWTLWPKF